MVVILFGTPLMASKEMRMIATIMIATMSFVAICLCLLVTMLVPSKALNSARLNKIMLSLSREIASLKLTLLVLVLPLVFVRVRLILIASSIPDALEIVLELPMLNSWLEVLSLLQGN